MKVRLEDLDERFRGLVLRRLGTFYRSPLDREFLDSLPRKIWVVPVPKEWDIGDYDWAGHPEAKKLHTNYAGRVTGGVFGHIIGGLLLAGGAVLIGLDAVSELGAAAILASVPLQFMPWLFQWTWRRRLRREVTRQELARALTEEPLSDIEHKYMRVLDEAMRMEEDPTRDRDVRRILRSCAEVVERHRELQEVRGALPEAPDLTAIERLDGEIGQVEAGMAEEQDVLVLSAQRDRLQSLQATRESLAQAGTLARRVDAQMKAIDALLVGAATSLARLRLSRGAGEGEETGALIERLNRLSIETTSLERAIVEVKQLSGEF